MVYIYYSPAKMMKILTFTNLPQRNLLFRKITC